MSKLINTQKRNKKSSTIFVDVLAAWSGGKGEISLLTLRKGQRCLDTKSLNTSAHIYTLSSCWIIWNDSESGITGLILVANLIWSTAGGWLNKLWCIYHFEMLQENNDPKIYSQYIICKVCWTTYINLYRHMNRNTQVYICIRWNTQDV